jgi:hypothetical protein
VVTDADQGLLKEKGGTGFPYLVFMDEEGEVLTRQGDRSVAGFEQTLGTLESWQKAKAAAARGDANAKVELLIAEMALGKLELADADKQVAALGKKTKEQIERIRALRPNLELKELMAQARELGRDGLAERVLTMKQEKRIPTGDQEANFWMQILQAGSAKQDASLVEEGLGELKRLKGGDKAYARFLESWQKRLEKMRGGE